MSGNTIFFSVFFQMYNHSTKEHPGQLLPFWQLLVLEWTPPPHSALHWAHGPHAVHSTGSGQGFCSLHSLPDKTNASLRCCTSVLQRDAKEWESHLSSRPWPTQTRPPWRGAGLLHERCRTSKPMPQLLLHMLQEDQGVQPPFLRAKYVCVCSGEPDFAFMSETSEKSTPGRTWSSWPPGRWVPRTLGHRTVQGGRRTSASGSYTG